MNTPNNKRRQQSQEKIEKAFIELLQTREINQITVSDICKKIQLNRSTFYANYTDVYELADRLRDRLVQEVDTLYDNDLVNKVGNDYLKLFRHIKENQLFYKTYFKLGYDQNHLPDLGRIHESKKIFSEKHLEYHIQFHRAGLNAIIKIWMENGCQESPEEMVEIIQSEYRGRLQ